MFLTEREPFDSSQLLGRLLWIVSSQGDLGGQSVFLFFLSLSLELYFHLSALILALVLTFVLLHARTRNEVQQIIGSLAFAFQDASVQDSC